MMYQTYHIFYVVNRERVLRQKYPLCSITPPDRADIRSFIQKKFCLGFSKGSIGIFTLACHIKSVKFSIENCIQFTYYLEGASGNKV